MFGASPIEVMALNAMLDGRIYCQGFVYSALWQGATLLGANAALKVPTQITADSDFVIQRLNLVSFTAADTPEVNPDFTLQIELAGSGRLLFDQAQNVNNVCGNFFDNRVPSDLPFPILIQANNTLAATLTNLSAVAQHHTNLSYIGFKVYYLQTRLQDGSLVPTTRESVFHVL